MIQTCAFAPEAARNLREKGYRARPLEEGLPDWALAGLHLDRLTWRAGSRDLRSKRILFRVIRRCSMFTVQTYDTQSGGPPRESSPPGDSKNRPASD
jgi:hypothetical protein